MNMSEEKTLETLWVLNVKWSDGELTEVSAVTEDYHHGKVSYGWPGPEKKIFRDGRTPLDDFLVPSFLKWATGAVREMNHRAHTVNPFEEFPDVFKAKPEESNENQS